MCVCARARALFYQSPIQTVPRILCPESKPPDVNLTTELHLMANTIRRLKLCCTRRSGCISLTYFLPVSIWPCNMKLHCQANCSKCDGKKYCMKRKPQILKQIIFCVQELR